MKPWTRKRKLGALLALSIAMNLFLVSMIAGRWVAERVPVVQAARNLEEVLAPLPAEKRAVVRNELRAVAPQIKDDFAALAAARVAMAEEFAKPTLDSTAIERHFAEIRARTNAIQAHLQGAFRRAAELLTQAERTAVLAVIRKRELTELPEF
ncbi:MAG: periplasmic heavy metal sensor [Burkholderiales bacterium]